VTVSLRCGYFMVHYYDGLFLLLRNSNLRNTNYRWYTKVLKNTWIGIRVLRLKLEIQFGVLYRNNLGSWQWKSKWSALNFPTHSYYIYKQKVEKDHKLSNQPIRCPYFKHIMHANEKRSPPIKTWPGQNDDSSPNALCHMYLDVGEIQNIPTWKLISLGNKPASEPDYLTWTLYFC